MSKISIIIFYRFPYIWLGRYAASFVNVMGRRALENNEGYELRESQSPYNNVFTLLAFDFHQC
jgi:hypothetical protein